MEITPAAEAASSDKPFRFTLADTTRAAKKLSWSTGKAAWTFGTSFCSWSCRSSSSCTARNR